MYYGLSKFEDGWNFGLRRIYKEYKRAIFKENVKHDVNAKLPKIVMIFSKFHKVKESREQ